MAKDKVIIKAREIKIPSNLPELLDRRAGRKEGSLRNIVADGGKLREINREAFTLTLGFEAKKMMENEDLPEKPMSLERLSGVMFTLMVAYITGTLHLDPEDGRVYLGTMTDTIFIKELTEADEFHFRGGKKIAGTALFPILQQITRKESIAEIYRAMAKTGPITKRSINPGDAMVLGALITKLADDFAESELFDTVDGSSND